MKDEQIRKNAADYVYNFQPTGVIIEDRLKCYIAGAHSRDREVMDLEHLLNVERISNKVLIEANEKLRNPWISAEERLPDIDKEVFVLFGEPSVAGIGYLFDDEDKAFMINGFGVIVDVTHWMPIPELKK